MDDAGAVRGHEHRGDGVGDAQLLRRGEAVVHRLLKRAAVDQLEHQYVGDAVVDEIVDAADVRVVELRERPRLADQTGARFLVELAFTVQNFQGDAARQPHVEAFVDVPHAALAEDAVDADVAKTPAGKIHGGRSDQMLLDCLMVLRNYATPPMKVHSRSRILSR